MEPLGGRITTRISWTAESIHRASQLSRFALPVVMDFTVTMAMAGKKEPPIARRTAIRILKKHTAKEPFFDAFSSRTEESFTTTIGTTRDLRLRSGFLHWDIQS